MNCSTAENIKALVARIFFLFFLFTLRELIYLQPLTTTTIYNLPLTTPKKRKDKTTLGN